MYLHQHQDDSDVLGACFTYHQVQRSTRVEWQVKQGALGQYSVTTSSHPCAMPVYNSCGSQWLALHPPQPTILALPQYPMLLLPAEKQIRYQGVLGLNGR